MIPFFALGAAAAGALVLYLLTRGPAPGGSVPALGAGGSVAACRAAVPVEPGLKPTREMLGGHIYNGHDLAHIEHVRRTLDEAAAAATGEKKRAILAFKALQGREGSTAAINTYDNQIVTWGTGWGGLGALSSVMQRLNQDPAVVARLAACGVWYRGHGVWAVDDGHGKIVEGKREALQVIRQTPALLHLLIHVAKDPATRDAVTRAQLDTFLAGSGSLPGSETIATQALYNFASHLKHWAPAYMRGVIAEAAAKVPGPPSPERDRRLAVAIAEGFYARAPEGSYPRKQWRQFQGYVRDMRTDGLDVTADPVLAAADPPAPPAKEVRAA